MVVAEVVPGQVQHQPGRGHVDAVHPDRERQAGQRDRLGEDLGHGLGRRVGQRHPDAATTGPVNVMPAAGRRVHDRALTLPVIRWPAMVTLGTASSRPAPAGVHRRAERPGQVGEGDPRIGGRRSRLHRRGSRPRR